MRIYGKTRLKLTLLIHICEKNTAIHINTAINLGIYNSTKYSQEHNIIHNKGGQKAKRYNSCAYSRTFIIHHLHSSHNTYSTYT